MPALRRANRRSFSAPAIQTPHLSEDEILVPPLAVKLAAGKGVPFGVGVLTTVWISLPRFTTMIQSWIETAGVLPVRLRVMVPEQSAFSE